MTEQNPLLREVFQLGKEAMVSASLLDLLGIETLFLERILYMNISEIFFLGILPNQCQFLFRKRSVATLN